MHDHVNADDRAQRAVLSLVLFEHPALLAASEVEREIGPGDAVARALTDLTGAGLLRREGATVLPTRAALHFDRLGGVSVREQFASNLRHLRKRSGYSQEELSYRADLHRTNVGMLERAVRMPRIDTLVKLAGALGVTPAELLDGIEWTPPEPVAGSFEVSESPPT